MTCMISTKHIFFTGIYISFIIGVYVLYKMYKIYSKSNSLRSDSYVSTFEDKFNGMYILNYYNIPESIYTRIREYMLVVGMVLVILSIVFDRSMRLDILCFTLVLYLWSTPEDTVFGVPTLTSLLSKLLYKKYNNDIDTEIYNVVGWMKNLALCEDTHLSNPVVILERAIDLTSGGRSALKGVLDKWQLGDIDGGMRCYKQYYLTSYCDKFSTVLGKLDYLTLGELVVQLESLEDIYRKEFYTKSIRNRESNSLKAYALVTITAIVILLNFIYIAVFIDSMNSLTNLL